MNPEEIREMAKKLIPLYRSKGYEREAVCLEIDAEIDKLLDYLNPDKEFKADEKLQVIELQYVKYLLTQINEFIENKLKESEVK